MNEIHWEQTDSPATADIAAIDDGLELVNQKAADLASVSPLCEFRGFPRGAIKYVIRKKLCRGLG